MIGTPITYFQKYNSGTYGYIIRADIDDLSLETVLSVQFSDESDTTKFVINETESTLTDLVKMPSDSSCPDTAWSLSSSILYLFIKNGYMTADYTSATKFVAYGRRIGIPIVSEDSLIDVPEKHIELFMKYAIKEAAQLLGKQIPASITNDIERLETKLKG